MGAYFDANGRIDRLIRVNSSTVELQKWMRRQINECFGTILAAWTYDSNASLRRPASSHCAGHLAAGNVVAKDHPLIIAYVIGAGSFGLFSCLKLP